MEHSTRLAHISEDGNRTQTVYDHLAGTARLAGSFAVPFEAQSEAEFAAWLHDEFGDPGDPAPAPVEDEGTETEIVIDSGEE